MGARDDGLRLERRVRVFDADGDDVTPYEGAVYAWHCDREGRCSMSTTEISDEDHLRGVQAAGSDGRLEFATIFPAAYLGRWFADGCSLQMATVTGSVEEGYVATLDVPV